MIVVGGWPGRKVVGLNGRFGVRPADFAAGGDFDNPFLNDVDAGDETREFVGVVSSLPGSGSVVFDDLGGFQHTGAADGTYATVFNLFTWAQGGPIVAHTPPETITTTFGSAVGGTAQGVMVSVLASLLPGSASGQVAGTAAGALIAVQAALLPGQAVGQSAGTAAGVLISATANLIAGAATGQVNATAQGVVIAASAGVIAGTATGQGSASAAGVLVALSAALLPGSASGQVSSTALGSVLTLSTSLVPGTASGPQGAVAGGVVISASCAAIPGRATNGAQQPPFVRLQSVLREPPRFTTVWAP
jgi:hypothetical protein